MDEKQDDYRPLSEEERRENMRKLLGEDAADQYFDGVGDFTPSEGEKPYVAEMKNNSLVNWRFIGIVALIFFVVMVGTYMVTSERVNEETIPGGPQPTVQQTETPASR